MSRYFTRPRGGLYVEDDHYSPDPIALHIPIASDHQATDTGLLDAHGDTIMRAPNPVGFIWEGGW